MDTAMATLRAGRNQRAVAAEAVLRELLELAGQATPLAEQVAEKLPRWIRRGARRIGDATDAILSWLAAASVVERVLAAILTVGYTWAWMAVFAGLLQWLPFLAL